MAAVAPGDVGLAKAAGGVSNGTCWCGSSGHWRPAPHAAYLICAACGTAVLRPEHHVDTGQVEREDDHLYGAGYWNEHMVKYGYPTIEERRRADIPERCQHWLKWLLEYKVPPGRLLEVGCSHGGFVKLASLAGFDALGMEMSPAVIGMARSWFGVEVLQGPLESVADPPRGLDAVLMFDVIEHFSDPLATMDGLSRCLADEGILVLQTPCFDKAHDPVSSFALMYKVPEHTFLFSRASIRQLLGRLGFTHVEEQAPLFPYDMFLFASRRPLQRQGMTRIADALSSTPNGRMALAMLDLRGQLEQTRAELAAVVADPSVRVGFRPMLRSLVRAFAKAIARRLGGG